MNPQESIAHYRIVSKLGEGGMGEVYRATDTKLGRDVAIKILPDAFAQDADRMARFQREAQVLAALNHPNIAAIYGVEERALVMELVEGPTLAGPMPLEQALPIIHQLVDALEYAHEKGVIHRDLKPANIKVTPEGRVKVLDFGLAKALSNDAAAADPTSSPTLTMRATLAGVIMGTAGYMAPEQARGHSVDQRADIWSFGVVVYEMLTGRQLFTGPTVSDTLASVLKEEPDWEAVPPRLRKLVRSCLMKEPRRRMRDIGDARLLLDETPAVDAAPQARSIPRFFAAALTVVTLVGAALAVIHFREPAPERPPLMRFQIPVDRSVTRIAISPDGRRLAFIAPDAEGSNALWVRPLDSLESRRLAPADLQSGVFWSPDSRWIGFISESRLKKIEASGGSAQSLCGISGTVPGGAWNRYGVILFGSIPSGGGIFRVLQGGGNPAQVTTPAASTAHGWPQFLPDGRHFIYFEYAAGGGEKEGVYLASLDGGQPKHLLDSHFEAVFAPAASGNGNGHLLFLRENTLMAQAWDSASMDLIGEAFPIAEPVFSFLSYGFFTVSANGILAYRSGSAEAGNLTLAWYDRAGKQLSTIGSPGLYGDLALSPDGVSVAVSQLKQAQNRDLWLIDSRGMSKRFTSDPAPDLTPLWTTDGKRIVFHSPRNDQAGIYQKNATGVEDETLLLKNGNQPLPYSFSPDGQLLLYGVRSPKTLRDLWILPMEGERKPVPFLESVFNELLAEFSPATAGPQQWVSYASDESGMFEVYVESYPRGKSKYPVSKGGGGQARWRPDGKELFYLKTDGTLMAVDVKTSPTFEAGPPRALFQTHIYMAAGLGPPGFRYAISLDGKRFLIESNVQAAEAPTAVTIVSDWRGAVAK